jgi:hypothetical protein
MVTGVTYEEVLDGWFDGRPLQGGLWEDKLKQILEGITEARWKLSYPRPRPRFGAFRLPEWPVVVLVETGHVSWHYVAAKGQLVHDPLLAVPFVQSRYPGQGSRVHATISPTKPALLPRQLLRRRRSILESLGRELCPARQRTHVSRWRDVLRHWAVFIAP